jgi:hypothetical protein
MLFLFALVIACGVVAIEKVRGQDGHAVRDTRDLPSDARSLYPTNILGIHRQ